MTWGSKSPNYADSLGRREEIQTVKGSRERMEQKRSRSKGGKREMKKLKMEGEEKEKKRSKKREGGLQRRRGEEKRVFLSC